MIVDNFILTISGDRFYINGEPTYKGRSWVTTYGGEYPVEGLLMNARLVQGIFDDLNPQTRGQWVYPDTTRELSAHEAPNNNQKE